jgi:hypothetical protein
MWREVVLCTEASILEVDTIQDRIASSWSNIVWNALTWPPCNSIRE